MHWCSPRTAPGFCCLNHPRSQNRSDHHQVLWPVLTWVWFPWLSKITPSLGWEKKEQPGYFRQSQPPLMAWHTLPGSVQREHSASYRVLCAPPSHRAFHPGLRGTHHTRWPPRCSRWRRGWCLATAWGASWSHAGGLRHSERGAATGRKWRD